ncbi:Hypothetical protein I596_223 [Dokdonella koreensis DS-123]|uniref:Uncharacterized protein n=1 Tax=Dokdonella koreensis DS-123 TaxID=1300342 RepID=A0A167G8H9_9GAMM|nr:Hypothetical protein I596_223 [Dokdonella koreensis DS-123]
MIPAVRDTRMTSHRQPAAVHRRKVRHACRLAWRALTVPVPVAAGR